MNKAAFLDRDGVINRKAASEGEYVTHWERMQILPGVAEAIALLNRAGYLVIVVSNQRSVAKGLVTAADLDVLHRRMCDELARAGARIDAVYYCPHELQPPCGCRKPQPGMLLQASRTHNLKLSASWMIGDSDTDIDAGKNAGCRTVRVLRTDETVNGKANLIAQSLLDATQQILECEKSVAIEPRPTKHAAGAIFSK